MDTKTIDKVLSKSASTDEAIQVAAWFNTNEGQDYFSQRFDNESNLLDDNLISEWSDQIIPSERMKIRIFSQLRMKSRFYRFRLAAAVIIPFIMLAGTFTFIVNRSGVFSYNEMAEVVVPFGEQMKVVLQDGSTVQLNSGSHLQYPKSFGLFSRKVKLTGEAYFSVAKETGRPFLVNLNEINVKVTGTKFNVKAYSDDRRISVALEEGSVNISDKSNNVYSLKVGQNADYDKNSGICTVNKTEDMTVHTAWRTKSLNFYRTPLKDILITLERQYEVKFDVKDSSLLNYKFSISTSKVNASEILTDLEKVSKIRFSAKGNNNFMVSSLK